MLVEIAYVSSHCDDFLISFVDLMDDCEIRMDGWTHRDAYTLVRRTYAVRC